MTSGAIRKSYDGVVACLPVTIPYRRYSTNSAHWWIGRALHALTTRAGQRIRGARKGEDAFSIQIMDTHERLQGYLKADLRDVSRDSKSLMPDYGPDAVNDRDLDDLLAFLSTLRSEEAPRRGRP
jgi:hypothetical protein